jgi:16S rRNA (guanine1207-N2)-methyltransferase
MSTQNIYGVLPLEFNLSALNARQYSPLIPNTSLLEDCKENSLSEFTIHAPNGTLERRYVLAHALRALSPQAPLIVLAAKDKGGQRLKKELVNFGCEVIDEPRHHFRICHTSRPAKMVGIDEAIKEGAPRLLDSIPLWSQPGVFSWDRLDPGSTLLIEHLPILSGSGADLGCGIGYLSLTILKSTDLQHLTLIDIDRRAISCAQKNIKSDKVSFLWADIFALDNDIKDLDFVVMNPPFHDTGIENHSLGQKFIGRAHQMLRSKGVCWLTANRHLPYEASLKQLFKDVKLKAEDHRYKIFQAVK